MDDRTVDDTRRDELTRIKGEGKGEAQGAIVVRNVQPLNDLARASSKRAVSEPNLEFAGTLYATGAELLRVIKVGQLQIFFEDPDIRLPKIMPRTQQLLTLLISTIPKNLRYGPQTVALAETTLSYIMDMRGLNSRSEARKVVGEDLDALESMAITIKDKADLEGIAKGGIALAGDKHSFDRRGNIVFTFSPSFTQLITSSKTPFFFLLVDPKAFQTDFKRNPHAWPLYWRILNHNSANLGEPNETTLSVRILLESAPELARYEDVKDRAYTRRIIMPFERDMDALVDLGVLEYWDYCHSKGEPLTDEEQAQRFDENGDSKPLPYEIAVTCYATWKLANQYAREERLDKKQKRQQKRIANAEANRNEARKSRERIQKQKERYIAKAEAEEELKARRKAKKKA